MLGAPVGGARGELSSGLNRALDLLFSIDALVGTQIEFNALANQVRDGSARRGGKLPERFQLIFR